MYNVMQNVHCVVAFSLPLHMYWVAVLLQTQGCFMYRHDQVLHCLCTELLTEVNMVSVYADLSGL